MPDSILRLFLAPSASAMRTVNSSAKRSGKPRRSTSCPADVRLDLLPMEDLTPQATRRCRDANAQRQQDRMMDTEDTETIIQE